MDIPDSAPPVDGEAAAGRPVPGAGAEDGADRPGGGSDGGGPGGGSDGGGPGGGPDERGGPGGGPDERGGPGGPGPAGPGPAGPGAGGGGWPSQFAQVLAETLAGSRPASQLTPWTTEQTRRRIRQLGPMLATGQRPRVRRIMTSAPSQDVLELTAVVGFGSRVRVLALRLERGSHTAGQNWRCTAIESA
jgi:Family of unknown function (DUF6459)